MVELKEKIKQQGKEIKQRSVAKIGEYILAAFGLVAGLAWNEAIKSLIEQVFPQSGNNVWAKFSYALIITLIVVIVSLYLVNILKRDGDEQQ